MHDKHYKRFVIGDILCHSLAFSFLSFASQSIEIHNQSISGTWPADGTPLVARPVSWWNEALHGIARGCGEKCATQFPEANAMSMSFNATLWRMIGETISTEGRAFFHVGGLNGLTFFTPQLNMAANPLWGRNME